MPHWTLEIILTHLDTSFMKKLRHYKISYFKLGQTVSEPGVEERSRDKLFSAFSLLWFLFAHHHMLSQTSMSMNVYREIHIYMPSTISSIYAHNGVPGNILLFSSKVPTSAYSKHL